MQNPFKPEMQPMLAMRRIPMKKMLLRVFVYLFVMNTILWVPPMSADVARNMFDNNQSYGTYMGFYYHCLFTLIHLFSIIPTFHESTYNLLNWVTGFCMVFALAGLICTFVSLGMHIAGKCTIYFS